jgi:carbohydrate kinase (thermoresistant glucokinase family)
MSNGIGLNDEQRTPWLLILHEKLKEKKYSKTNTVLACSALKSKYRKLLNSGLNDNDELNLKFILLNISYELVENRLKYRKHDFVKGSSILKSQFDTLEINDDFSYKLEIRDDKTAENCVDELINFLSTDMK